MFIVQRFLGSLLPPLKFSKPEIARPPPLLFNFATPPLVANQSFYIHINCTHPQIFMSYCASRLKEIYDLAG